MSWFANNIKYWATHFIPQFYENSYAESIGFWGDEPKDPSVLSSVPYTAVPTSGDLSRHALNSKLKGAIEHFLFNTTAGWFVRTVGDTAINFQQVYPVIRDLEVFDPLFDRVIQGACLGKYELTYVQGGSGFLFSRRAAWELLQNWDWVRRHAFEFKNDDRLLSAYLRYMNLSWYNATNRFFVGHSFWNFSNAYKAMSFKFHRPCHAVPRSKKGCRGYFTRVNELAFWHDRARFMRFIGRIDEIRAMIPDDLYFHVPNNKPMLCRSNRSIAGYYD
jgi:hypothetical protein